MDISAINSGLSAGGLLKGRGPANNSFSSATAAAEAAAQAAETASSDAAKASSSPEWFVSIQNFFAAGGTFGEMVWSRLDPGAIEDPLKYQNWARSSIQQSGETRCRLLSRL